MNFSPKLAAVPGAKFPQYQNLYVRLDAADSTLWWSMRPQGRPSFSLPLLSDIADFQSTVRNTFAYAPAGVPQPFRYCVLGSAIPRVFNLGGDLAHFSECIRSRDFEGLRHYGHTCVRAVYESSVAYDAPIITIALVQGAALGGGFECALSHDVIVAESGAKFGLPEIMFNMIPGMGAYSFLSRRLGRQKAEELITGGCIHTAEALHDLGLVDVVCREGEGVVAVQEYVREHSRRFPAELSLYRARRRAEGITHDELRDIVDIWAEGVLGLSKLDLRTMARLVAAQDKRGEEKRAAVATAAAAE